MWNKPDRRVVLKGLVGLAGVGSGFIRAADAPTPAAHGMRAVLLGTQGGPNFNPTRGETANVIVIDDRLYMVDCGYGALGALVRANLNYRNVDQVFLTHLHDDHTADLVSLMGHQWTGGRVAPTIVLGPAGTRRLVDAAIRYNEVNEQVRLIDEARSARLAKLFSAKEIAATASPQKIFGDADLSVSAVENTHYPVEATRRMPQRSLSLRFDARGRSIVFSGDTAWSQNLVRLARGADVLVCEAMHVAATRQSFDERVKAGAYADNPEGIWAHIVAAHTPLDVAGRMAREAGVQTLVLSHLIPGGWSPQLDDEFYRSEAAREFKGRIVVGRDGMEI